MLLIRILFTVNFETFTEVAIPLQLRLTSSSCEEKLNATTIIWEPSHNLLERRALISIILYLFTDFIFLPYKKKEGNIRRATGVMLSDG